MGFARKDSLRGAVVLNPDQGLQMFGNILEMFQRKRKLMVGTDPGSHKRARARAMRTLGRNLQVDRLDSRRKPELSVLQRMV